MSGPIQSHARRCAAVGVALLSVTIVTAALATGNSVHIKAYPNSSHEYQIAVTGYATQPSTLKVLASTSACPSAPSGVSQSVHHSFKYVRYVLTPEKHVCAWVVHSGKVVAHASTTGP